MPSFGERFQIAITQEAHRSFLFDFALEQPAASHYANNSNANALTPLTSLTNSSSLSIMADVDFMDELSEYSADDHFTDESDFDDEENVAPPKPNKSKASVKATVKATSKAKTSKPKAASKKINKVVSIEDSDDDDDDDDSVPLPLADRSVNKDNADAKGKGKAKTVEETYTKMSQLDHILIRPDTYSK